MRKASQTWEACTGFCWVATFPVLLNFYLLNKTNGIVFYQLIPSHRRVDAPCKAHAASKAACSFEVRKIEWTNPHRVNLWYNMFLVRQYLMASKEWSAVWCQYFLREIPRLLEVPWWRKLCYLSLSLRSQPCILPGKSYIQVVLNKSMRSHCCSIPETRETQTQ